MKPTSAVAAILLLFAVESTLAQTASTDESETMVWDGMPLKRSCEKDQATLNRCAFEVWQAADAEMNALYKEQVTYLAESQAEFKTDGKAKQRLVAAQRAWINFRDRDCDYQVGEPGSSGMFERHKCMYKRTSSRTQELREYVGCRYNGCPF